MLFFQTCCVSLLSVVVASRERFLKSTQPKIYELMDDCQLIVNDIDKGWLSTPCPITCILLRLMVSLKSLQAAAAVRWCWSFLSKAQAWAVSLGGPAIAHVAGPLSTAALWSMGRAGADTDEHWCHGKNCQNELCSQWYTALGTPAPGFSSGLTPKPFPLDGYDCKAAGFLNQGFPFPRWVAGKANESHLPGASGEPVGQN